MSVCFKINAKADMTLFWFNSHICDLSAVETFEVRDLDMTFSAILSMLIVFVYQFYYSVLTCDGRAYCLTDTIPSY